MQRCNRLRTALFIAVVGFVATRAEAGIVSATASGDATIGATYQFATPLAIGASEGFYIPIVILTERRTFTITESINSTPEPGSLTLLLSGLAGLGAIGCMKRRRARATVV